MNVHVNKIIHKKWHYSFYTLTWQGEVQYKCYSHSGVCVTENDAELRAQTEPNRIPRKVI